MLDTTLPILAVCSAVIEFAITILWLVIAWRAMRAHESLAESHQAIESHLRQISSKLPAGSVSPTVKAKPITEVDPSTFPKFSE